MKSKYIKEIFILIAVVLSSLLIDIAIANKFELPIKTPILINASIYLLYAGAIFATKFAMYSKITVDRFMENGRDKNIYFKTRMAIYAIIAAFALVALEGLF